VAANLIQGSLGEVIRFLDGLASGEGSAAGIRASQEAWRRTLIEAEWTRPSSNEMRLKGYKSTLSSNGMTWFESLTGFRRVAALFQVRMNITLIGII
jgi:hypothetical protein